MSQISNETQKFDFNLGRDEYIKDILSSVYSSLVEKGYDPISQMVGYIISGDPTYITSYNGARALIRKVERDELLEFLLKSYVERL